MRFINDLVKISYYIPFIIDTTIHDIVNQSVENAGVAFVKGTNEGDKGWCINAPIEQYSGYRYFQ